jgi:uncharacterized repeat protein (TIGR01451 family)
VAASTTTDGSGNYTLNLNPGSYTICEVLQAGWTQSDPANTLCTAMDSDVAPGGYGVTVTSNGLLTGNDFGNWHQGQVKGQKFEDLNADGIKNGNDAGLSGWTIRAYSSPHTVAASTTTDGSGNYTLNLNPGSYTICEVLQAGWTQSDPANTLCTAMDSDVAAGGYSVTVTSNGLLTGNDFGNWHQGQVRGQKFLDHNQDGTKNGSDTGLSGWTIRAYSAPHTIAASTTTDGSGNYTLNLNPGSYTICEVQQSGWNQSGPSNTLCTAMDSDVAPGGYSVTVTSSGSITGKDFANWMVDLAVTKSDGGAHPVAGGPGFVYTITVSNLGPSDALNDATVTDTLPAGVTFVSFVTPLPAGVVCNPPVAGVFTCTVPAGLLHVADPAVVIKLNVTVPVSTPAGTVTNVVVVSSPDEPCPGSPDCGNNTDHTDTPVTTTVDLEIHKTADQVAVAPGSTFTYTLAVNNLGPSDATVDATVVDVLPTDVTFSSFGTLPTGVTCGQPVGQTITCTIAKDLLQVSDPPVQIPIVVIESATATLPSTNKTIVTSPDDTAPCTVTSTNITCNPADTNNYSQVTVGVVLPEVVTIPPPAPALAFTGSDTGRILEAGAALALLGLLLVLIARRRRGQALGS